MKLMKYSPGPWTYTREESKRFDEATGEPRNVSFDWIKADKTHKYPNLPMAQVVASVMGSSLTVEESKANGALIAAAPDLLEALQHAKANIMQQDHYSEHLMERINLALKKAGSE